VEISHDGGQNGLITEIACTVEAMDEDA